MVELGDALDTNRKLRRWIGVDSSLAKSANLPWWTAPGCAATATTGKEDLWLSKIAGSSSGSSCVGPCPVKSAGTRTAPSESESKSPGPRWDASPTRTPVNPSNVNLRTWVAVDTVQTVPGFVVGLCRLPRSELPSHVTRSCSLWAPKPTLTGLVDRLMPVGGLPGDCPAPE